MTANGEPFPPAPGWWWRSEATALAGVVGVPTAGGGRFWVDVVDSDTVVSFHAGSFEALAGLTEVFGKDWCARLIRRAGPGGASSDDAWAPPPLRAGWTRAAVVLGVKRWMQEPVNELALLLDEALAWQDAGQDDWAEACAATLSELVPPLVAALHAGLLPQLAHADVEAAGRLIARALPPGDPDLTALERLEAAMQARTHIDQTELEDAIVQWSLQGAATANATGALGMGAGAVPASDRPTLETRVDPLTIAPRVIAWFGPHQSQITTVIDGNALHARLTLAPGIEPTDAEAIRLMLFVADADSREVLCTARVSPIGADEVGATLDLPARPPARLVVGAHDRDGPPLVRASTAVTFDRCYLGSWSLARLAMAAQPAPSSPASDIATGPLWDAAWAYAWDAGRTALDAEDEEAEAEGRLTTTSGQVRAERLRASLGRSALVASEGDRATRPLLAETLPHLKDIPALADLELDLDEGALE